MSSALDLAAACVPAWVFVVALVIVAKTESLQELAEAILRKNRG